MQIVTLYILASLAVFLVGGGAAYMYLSEEPPVGNPEASLSDQEPSLNSKGQNPKASGRKIVDESNTQPNITAQSSDTVKESQPKQPVSQELAALNDQIQPSLSNSVDRQKVRPKSSRENPPEQKLSDPSFDVVRVAPDGIAVFAGKAHPKSKVDIIVNGDVIETVQADSFGQWSAVAQLRNVEQDMKFSLRSTRSTQGRTQTASLAKPVLVERIIKPKPKAVASSNKSSRSRPSSARVETQKKARQENRVAILKKGPLVDAPKKDDQGKPIIVESKVEGVVVASPVPINFVYREATFTAEGELAAATLLEFVQKKKLKKVVLSGHTDERGSYGYNMGLSELRLQAVADYLKENGFEGEVALKAKGETEPMNIRNPENYSQEEIWQFNRRVELKGTE